MTFGLQCDEERSRAILDRALDGGVTFLDTADVYPLGGDLTTVGRTEEILGRYLAGRRDEVVLATKCFMPVGPRHWDAGMSAKHILSAIESSLRRLDTDYVDLYQLHFDDRLTPLDETLRALDDVVRSGKTRYVGVSNWAAWRLARAVERSAAAPLAPVISVQPRYNLLYRAYERDLFPLCEETGVGVIPYNPLAGGLLAGKHSQGREAPKGRFTLGNAGAMYRERYWHDGEFDTVEALRPLAEEAGVSLAHLAMGWVLAQPAVTAPIVGASGPEQLDDALAAVEKPLDPDLLRRVDELTRQWRSSDAER